MRSWSKSFAERVERRRNEERMRAYWLSRAAEIIGPEIAPPIMVVPSWKIPFRGLLRPDSGA